MEEYSHACLCTVGPYNVLSLHRDTVKQNSDFSVSVDMYVQVRNQDWTSDV